MRNACRNMNNITRPKGMHLSAGERRSEIFARRSAALLPAHRSAQNECAFAAVHDHDVDDLVVLFRETISVAIQQTEAVVHRNQRAFRARNGPAQRSSSVRLHAALSRLESIKRSSIPRPRMRERTKEVTGKGVS